MGTVWSKEKCSATRMGIIEIIQWRVLNPLVRFWNGITGVGKEDRLRMILGMISGGIWLDNDNETKIGIRIG